MRSARVRQCVCACPQSCATIFALTNANKIEKIFIKIPSGEEKQTTKNQKSDHYQGFIIKDFEIQIQFRR